MHIEAKDFDTLREACAGNERARKILDRIIEADRIRGMKFDRVTVKRQFHDEPRTEDCERLDEHWCIAQKWNLRGPVRGKFELLHIATGLGVGSIGKRADIIRMHEEMQGLQGMDWTDAATMQKSPDFARFRNIISRYRA